MNIHTLVAKGRGPLLEFLPEPEAEALAQLIVAFANTPLGGTIIVGLDVEERVYPDAAEYLEPVLARALTMIEPPLRASDLPVWQMEETPEGHVATITVRPTPYRVGLLNGAVYVRSGTLNIRLSAEQAAHERSQRPATRFEEEVVAGATPDDFDEDLLEDYQRLRRQRGPRGEVASANGSATTRTEFLEEAGAIDPLGRPTALGILLLGKRPQRFFPQVGVVVVRFRGSSVRDTLATSERYARRVEIVGPAPRLISNTLETLLNETRRQAHLEGLRREEVYEYPEKAMREAIVNAVCHRDYALTGQRIEVRLFDDHMEIISPGGLPGYITLENIRDEHYSRNKRLVQGVYYWGWIEELGQGIDIIYEEMQRAHHPAPELHATDHSFTVLLSNAVEQIERLYGENLNPRQLRALKFLADPQHERISNSDYQSLCPEVGAETLRLDLRDLVERGLLLKVGDKRGTYYVRKR